MKRKGCLRMTYTGEAVLALMLLLVIVGALIGMITYCLDKADEAKDDSSGPEDGRTKTTRMEV